MRSGTNLPEVRLRGVSVSFVLLVGHLALLTLAGGASRPDVFGQIIVRTGVVIGLALWFLIAPRPIRVARAPFTIVALAILLVALQLIPLPAALWSLREGDLLRDAAAMGLMPPAWRSLAIVPSATINALFSLMVPLAAILFAGACRPVEQRLVLVALLVVIGVNGLAELTQFAGGGLSNPFINGRPGQPSGLFANRNHLAVLLAIGCVMVPVWATLPGRTPAWRSWTAMGCVTLLGLMVFATGSRAGLFLGLLAVLMIPLILRIRLSDLRGAGGRHRRLLLVAVAVAGLALIALAFWAGRSESFDRLRDIDTATDMRSRAFPVILELLRQHWLLGAGFGNFEPLFRAAEPFALLKPTYFNQAHNDVLEIAIIGGIPAVALFVGAIIWVVIRGVRVWRGAPLGRLAVATILLIVIASLFDYPARTPIMMAILAISAVWLSENPHRQRSDASALTGS